MSEFYNWWLNPEDTNSKHQGHVHPIFISLTSMFFTISAGKIFAKIFEKIFPSLKADLPDWSRRYLSKLLTIYLIFMIGARYLSLGPVAFYDISWACNSMIIIMIVALFGNHPVLLSAAMINIAIDQVLWYVDLISFIITKKFAIGVMKYLTWPQTSWASIFTSTHHLWFLPICFLCLRKIDKVSFKAYILSLLINFIVSFYSRISIPKNVIYPDGKTMYLNVNSVYDSWKDVKKYYICSAFDDEGPVKYFIFHQCFWGGFSFIYFIIFRYGHKFICKKRMDPKIKNK